VCSGTCLHFVQPVSTCAGIWSPRAFIKVPRSWILIDLYSTLRNSCSPQHPWIAQQLLEFHHMHHDYDELRASCSMEELLTCTSHGRNWIDTDLHMTVKKYLWSSAQRPLENIFLPDPLLLEWPRMCGFSLVMQLCLVQQLELESALDSNIHSRLRSPVFSSLQKHCMCSIWWTLSHILLGMWSNIFLTFLQCHPLAFSSTIYILVQKLHRVQVLFTNKENNCPSLWSGQSWVLHLKIVMISLPAHYVEDMRGESSRSH
jgi:hypothetical protein